VHDEAQENEETDRHHTADDEQLFTLGVGKTAWARRRG
jgi:hypothetical protein